MTTHVYQHLFIVQQLEGGASSHFTCKEVGQSEPSSFAFSPKGPVARKHMLNSKSQKDDEKSHVKLNQSVFFF